MNNFIQHVTGQLVWLGEHRGLFLLLIVELFAGVCLLIGFFQLKIKKQNEAAGVFKGGSGSFGVPGNGDPVMILRCKDLYPVYITESFEQQLDVTGDDIKTDIGIFLDKVGSGKDWKLWKKYRSWDGKQPFTSDFYLERMKSWYRLEITRSKDGLYDTFQFRDITEDKKELEGKHLGFFTEFPTKEGEQVEMKVGISFVDMEGAANNFKQEIASKNFAQVKQEASDLWNKELSRIRISGGTDDEKTVFYTSLYHTMIDPRIYTDVDGRYIGGDKKVHEQDGTFTKRTIFSGWDVFRSQFPLQAMINPRLVSDALNSLITMADQSRREYYERWELLNSYSGCMIGNPALSVLADAYMKGIRTYDVEKAYQYAVNTSAKFGNDSLGYTPEPLSISYTLEYAYADWCVAQLAKALGKEEDAKRFYEKGQAYRNMFDAEKGWFRPRNADGSWKAWPENALTEEWYGCIESNAYQQGWFVPHDVPGMVELMGGKEEVIANLTNLFDHTPSDMLWNDYYNHANEPVHFVPFLFNQLDVPWYTQKWTRYICKNAYANKVEGIVGNEDVGQMSAWYILAASGIHPSCPGNTRMEITSPVFDKVEFNLDSKYHQGKVFTIIAHNNNTNNLYIQKALLNGKEYNKCYLDFAEIAAGGTLELFMGDKPNTEWGVLSNI